MCVYDSVKSPIKPWIGVETISWFKRRQGFWILKYKVLEIIGKSADRIRKFIAITKIFKVLWPLCKVNYTLYIPCYLLAECFSTILTLTSILIFLFSTKNTSNNISTFIGIVLVTILFYDLLPELSHIFWHVSFLSVDGNRVIMKISHLLLKSTITVVTSISREILAHAHWRSIAIINQI